MKLNANNKSQQEDYTPTVNASATALGSNVPDMKSGRDGSCPVCGRMHDQDCHWYSDNKTVLCYTKGAGGTSNVACPDDSVPAAIGGNYVFKGLTKDGRAGIYSLKVEQEEKSTRPTSSIDYFYQDANGQDLVKVTRKDSGDGRKTFSQLYFDPDAGAWEQWINTGKNPKGNIIWKTSFTEEQKDVLKAQVPLYNLPTVIAAIADGKDIWFVEGEGCADVLGTIGIVATTLIAGAGKLKAYNPKAIEVLHGARVVLCPDRDQKGLAHMEEIAAALGGKATALWCYCKPEHTAFWSNLQKDGGLDCKDWLDELRDLDSDKKRSTLYDAVGAAKNWNRQKIDKNRQKIDTLSIFETHANQGFQRKNRQIDTFHDIPGSKEEIEKIESQGEAKLDLHEVLLPELAAMLLQTAASLPTRGEALLTTLLPVVASNIGTSSFVEIRKGWDEPAVLWAMVVAPTGKMKTPTQKAMISPLIKLQGIANTKFESAHKKWEQAKKQWERSQKKGGKGGSDEWEEFSDPEPTKEHYWASDVTMEALVSIHSQNPRGLLCYYDEADSFYSSFNKYRSGGGGDEQAWLEINSGNAVKVDRVSKNLSLERTAVSIVGSIQPATIEPYLGGKKDTSGMNARWLYFCGEMPSRRITRIDRPDELGDCLERTYKILRSIEGDRTGNYDERGEPIDSIDIPRKYKLSPDALALWESKWEEPTNLLIEREIHEGMKAVLNKYIGFCARIALVLHLLEWSYTKMSGCIVLKQPSTEIELETIERAIKITEFYVQQARILYRQAGSDPEDGTPVMRKMKEISLKLAADRDSQGWVTGSQATRSSRALRNVAHAHELFFEMAAAGFGVVDDLGKKPKWKFIDKTSILSIFSEEPLEPSYGGVSEIDSPSISVYSPSISANLPSIPSSFKVDDQVRFDLKFWYITKIRDDRRLELKLLGRLNQTAIANVEDVELIVVIDEPVLEPEALWKEPAHDASFGDADDVATAIQDRINWAIDSGDDLWISEVRRKYEGLSQPFRKLVDMGLDDKAVDHMIPDWSPLVPAYPSWRV